MTVAISPLFPDARSPISPLRILLVEDNHDNQLVTALMLESLGYQIDVAGDGVEALRLHHQGDHDVVLLDLRMPRLDGFGVAQALRQRSGLSIRPWIIALTANAFDGDLERCLAGGMNDYVTKPIDLERLETALERAAASLPPREAVRNGIASSSA